MGITQIKRDWGDSVFIVRITTTDNLATVGTTNYLKTQAQNIASINAGAFHWDPTDFVLVHASDGWGQFTISPDFNSLINFTTESVILPPVTVGDIAIFNSASQIKDGGQALPNNVFVVSTTGKYQTIQSAINAAALVATDTNPAAVVISPGIYNENLTFKDFVNVTGIYGSNGAFDTQLPSAGSIIINGFQTYTPVASDSTMILNNINFIGPSTGTNPTFTLGGSTGSIVDFNNCGFFAFSTGAASCFSSANGNPNINFFNCGFNTANACKVWDIAGSFPSIYYCFVVNGTATASTINGGNLFTEYCDIIDHINITNHGHHQNYYLNASAGSNSYVTIDATSNATFHQSVVGSSAPWATGSGTLIYDVVSSFQTQHNVSNVSAGQVTTGALSSVGPVSVTTAGQGLAVKEGSNAKQGVVTLSAGVGVVSNTSVTATSRIFYCGQDTNVTGFLKITARTTGSGFTITSSVNTDTGVVAYEIFEPA